MSSLRPFNTSKKAPKSAMLKGFSTDKNVTRQLEIDSRRMEEKLTQLKVTMNREKQERQAHGRGNIWASGRPNGPMASSSSETKKKTKPGPQRPSRPADKNKVRRIKVLKDVPLDVPERPKVTNGLSAGDSTPPRRSIKGPVCGQCEAKPVSLTCMECGENYCTTCFARFHLKGALRNHRSVPYQSPPKKVTRSSWEDANNNAAVASRRPETPKSSRGSTSHRTPGERGKVVVVSAQQDAPQGGGSLLEGDYNEEESAASFAAALAEWRNGKKPERAETATSKPEVHDMGVGDTSVRASVGGLEPVEIKFSDSSLSYADKLLLKQHHRKSPRITPSPSLNGWSPDSLGQRGATPNMADPVYDEATPAPSREAPDHPLAIGRSPDSLGHGAATLLQADPVNDRSAPELDAELREEHERCVGIFSRNEESDTWLDRPSSQLMITEVKDEPIGGDLEVESVYSVEESQPAPQRPRHGSRCQVVPITGTEEVQESQPADIMDQGYQGMGTATQNNPRWTHGTRDSDLASRDRQSLQNGEAAKLDDRFRNPDPATMPRERSVGGEGGINSGINQVPGRVISSRKGSRREQKTGPAVEPQMGLGTAVSGGLQGGQSSSTSHRSGPSSKGSSGMPSNSKKGPPRGMTNSMGSSEEMQEDGETRSKESLKGQGTSSAQSRSRLEKKSPRGLSTVPSEGTQVVRERIANLSRTSIQPGDLNTKGLTKTSSEALQKVVKNGVQNGQHHGYLEGLGGFFMAGMGDQERGKETARRDERVTCQEVTYQGPSLWRPSSSLSENLGTVHTPSPPKQTRESSGSASLRRKKQATKKDKPVDGSTISWVLSQQPPPPGMEAMSQSPGVGSFRSNNNAASSRVGSGRDRGETPRAESRIEIEGDDYARFDEDDGMDGQDRADQETLDELTWELASQSGRISADGRITSLSLQEVDPYVETDKFASSLDEELGIRLDDGRGSGLSSPEDQELTLEAVSTDDLLETKRDQKAVQDLDDFI